MRWQPTAQWALTLWWDSPSARGLGTATEPGFRVERPDPLLVSRARGHQALVAALLEPSGSGLALGVFRRGDGEGRVERGSGERVRIPVLL